METDSGDPRDALAAIDQARHQVGERVAAPLWFHLGLGALLAQHIVFAGFGTNWTGVSFAVLVVGAIVLALLMRHGAGVAIGFRNGKRSDAVMTARFVAAGVCIWAAALVDDVPVTIAAAVVGFVSAVLLGVLYDDAVRRDLVEGAAV